MTFASRCWPRRNLALGLLLAALLLAAPLFSLLAMERARRLPWQVHIALTGRESSSITIMWVTQSEDMKSEVEWGLVDHGSMKLATGQAAAYTHRGYTSGLLHFVELHDLEPDRLYRYRCGDATHQAWSREYTFRTKPVSSASDFKSVTLGVVGDTGCTEDAQHVLEAMTRDDSLDMVLHVGDHSYANGHDSKWDNYGAILESLAATKVYMGTVGNHELYNDFGSSKPYSLRYRMPLPDNNATVSSLPDKAPANYYSFNYGPVHVIVLNSEEFAPHQPRWLASDLQQVDRAKTPWIVVSFHTPWYNSNYAHHNEGALMKAQYEEVLARHEVDLVLAGHVHAYERTHPVYKDARRERAPVYVNVGTGGTHEGHSTHWFQPPPAWSAMRESEHWGYGTLQVVNATHARWAWHRVEARRSTGLGDFVWLSRPSPSTP